MKTVFDNHMVAHVWAQQEQQEGRSGNGNFYFEGPTIYSYRMGYPVGNFVKDCKGNEVVLLWNGSYSVTTSSHQRMAENAVRGKTTFRVPHLLTRYSGIAEETAHAANLQDLTYAFEAEVARLLKSSKRSGGRALAQWDSDRLVRGQSEILSYCKAFRCKVPASVRRFDIEAFTTEHDRNVVEYQNKAEEKAKKLLARLGSQEAVNEYHERQRLLRRINALGKRRIYDDLQTASYISYDDRRALDDVLRDVAQHVESYPDDTTVRAHRDRLDTVCADYKAKIKAEAEERERRRLECDKAYAERKATFDAACDDRKLELAEVSYEAMGWLSDDLRISGWRRGYKLNAGLTKTAMLRLADDNKTIQTSWHASFPIEHAVKAWPLLKRLFQRGQAWQRNGQEIRLGHFHIDRVDAEGLITAGCHTVERAEVERLAKHLGSLGLLEV